MKTLTNKQIVIISSVAVVSLTAAAICYIIFNLMNRTSMKISARGLNLIKEHEGLRLTAYQCSADVWTIGYGHTQGVSMGDTCTQEQAEQWLMEDIAKAEKAVNRQGLAINQNQFDALVSFVFNLGETAFKSSTLLKKIKANPNDPTIADEFAKWKYAGGNVVAGLVTRRNNESNLYFG